MGLKLNKVFLLGLLLFSVLVMGFSLRNFPFSGGDFDNPRTAIMTSTDVAYFTWRVESSYASEMPVIEPPYTTDGVENVITGYPALMNTFGASFSKLTSINPYQVAFILICLLSALIPLYAFIIVRRYFGTEPAIIVLMLAMFAPLTIIFPVYIGFWADVYSYAPAIAAIFFLKELWTKRRTMPLLLFAALSSAGLLGHGFEFMYCLFAICLSLLLIILSKQENRKVVAVNLAITLILILAFSLLYFIRADGVTPLLWGNTFKLGEARSAPLPYFRIIALPPVFYIGTLIGAFALIYLTLKRKYGLMSWAIISYSLFLVLLYFSRFIGVEAHQTYRQFYSSYWLIILPSAIGLSFLCGLIRQKLSDRFFITALLIAGLVVASSLAYAATFKELSAIDQSTLPKDNEWDSMMWLKNNTPKDSKILIFFGLYEQGFDIHSERMSTPYPFDENLLYQVCNGAMPVEYNTNFRYYMFSKYNRFKLLNPDQSVSLLYRNLSTSSKNLADFDYVLARYQGTQIDPCIQFYVSQLINQSNEVVWYDNSVVIVKVNKDGN